MGSERSKIFLPTSLPPHLTQAPFPPPDRAWKRFTHRCCCLDNLKRWLKDVWKLKGQRYLLRTPERLQPPDGGPASRGAVCFSACQERTLEMLSCLWKLVLTNVSPLQAHFHWPPFPPHPGVQKPFSAPHPNTYLTSFFELAHTLISGLNPPRVFMSHSSLCSVSRCPAPLGFESPSSPYSLCPVPFLPLHQCPTLSCTHRDFHLPVLSLIPLPHRHSITHTHSA